MKQTGLFDRGAADGQEDQCVSAHPKPGRWNGKWRLEDHLCQKCLGRLLSGKKMGVIFVKCSNCGEVTKGKIVTDICICAAKTPSGKDAGIKCQKTTAVDAFSVVTEVSIVAKCAI